MSKRIKVILTKAGTAYDASKAYKLLDYIVVDNTTMYVCKRVDKDTMTCVGHALTETDYWDKCIDMADAIKKVNDAVATATTATATANKATKAANDAAATATTATTNANKAVTDAKAATDKANTSATQADTATQQATDAATAAEKVNASLDGSTLTITDRTGKKSSLTLAEQAETKKTLDALAEKDTEQDGRLASLEQAVGDIGGTTEDYYYASQDTSKASPDLVDAKTNSSAQMLQDLYRPFLVNHDEAKDGVEVMPAYELQRNNWLRFKNGKFAPAVGITEEMRAQCDVELYLDAAHTEKYCDAGAFNAETFYNQYGLTQKLYDASGNEIRHILRPWETTSKNYSVMVGAASGMYLLDGYSTKDGEQDIMYKGIMKSYREVAGIKPKYLAPTLMAPCHATSIKGTDGITRFRTFPFLYNPGDDNTKGGYNTNFGVKMFYDDGCYPRVNDVNQTNSKSYARNNNADRTKPYPFAEAGFHAYNAFMIAHEVLYGTNFLNDANNLFSTGTSSVDWFATGDEAGWKKYGGIRFKAGDDGTWTHTQWGVSPTTLCKDNKGTAIGVTMSVFINYEFPKWREMEAQLALSFAAELGIQENTEFEVYGQKYRYIAPTKAKGLADGYMNAIVYKVVAGEWQGYDTSGNAVTWKLEANLRQGLMDGVATSGDIYHYRGGGYEQVATNHYTSMQGQTGQNEMDLYLETDQRKWHSETADNKIDLGVFGFESQYEHLAHVDNVASGWLKQRIPYTPFYKTVGGSRSTYASAFNDNSNWYSSRDSQRVRTAVRLGGSANWYIVCSRSLTANTSVWDANRNYGGSAQCLFKAAQPQ